MERPPNGQEQQSIETCSKLLTTREAQQIGVEIQAHHMDFYLCVKKISRME